MNCSTHRQPRDVSANRLNGPRDPAPLQMCRLSAPNDLICWLSGLKEAFYFPWLCFVCSDPQGLLRQNVSIHYSFLAQVIFIRAKQSQHTTEKILKSRFYAKSKIQAIPVTLSSSLKSHHNLKLYCNIIKKKTVVWTLVESGRNFCFDVKHSCWLLAGEMEGRGWNSN